MSSINVMLNQSNWNPQTGTLTYKFPTAVQFQNQEISLNACSMYNSFFNISAELGNNVITYTHPIFTGPNAYTMTDYTITLPNGYYKISDLDNQLQNLCLLNGLYCIDAARGKNVYFVQLSENEVRYAFQLSTYYVPTSAQCSALGFTSGGMALNTGNLQVSPRVTISGELTPLLGMSAGIYPPTVLTSTSTTWQSASAFTKLSSQAPQVNPVTSVSFLLDVVNNTYSTPTNLIAMIPITASFGAAVQYIATQPLWSKVLNQQFAQITLSFADQNGNRLRFHDTEISCILAIREIK